jgi:hypothetical protein
MAKKWIAGAIKHPGALLGQKIPEAKIEKASVSKDMALRKEAQLAKTLKGFRKSKTGRGRTK